jgi:adenylate kinase
MSEELTLLHIDLSKYSKEKGFIISEDKARETSIVDMVKLRQSIIEVLDKSIGDIILDGHYAQDLVPIRLVSKIFVIRKAPWLLKHILEQRGYDRSKVNENLEAEIMGVCLNEVLSVFPHKLVCELDTTNKTVEDTLKEALTALSPKGGCGLKRIDWLSYKETMELLRV